MKRTSMMKNLLAPAVALAFASSAYSQTLSSSPSSLFFASGGATTQNVTISISSGGPQSLTSEVQYGFSPVSPTPTWLTAGSGSTGTSIPVTINTAPGGSPLPNGNYTANVVFRLASSSGTLVSVPVTLQITGSAGGGSGGGGGSTTLVSPNVLNLSGTFPNGSFQINATSTAQLYTITGAPSWLSVFPTSNTTVAGVATTINVSAFSSLISTSGTAVLTVTVGSQSQTVTVNYTPAGGSTSGLLSLSTTFLNYAVPVAASGDSSSITTYQSQFTLTTTQAMYVALVSSTSVNNSAGQPWVKTTPDNIPQTVANASNPIGVIIDPRGLSAGTYQGTITVYQGGTSTVLGTLSVTLSVGSNVSPTSITVSVPFPASFNDITTRQVTVTAPGKQVTISAPPTDSGGGWLQVPSFSGTLGQTAYTLTATFNPIGLQAGSYTGKIVVAIQGQANQEIPITLIVGTGTGGLVSPNPLNISAAVGGVGTGQITINTGTSANYNIQGSGVTWLTFSNTIGIANPTAIVTVTANAASLSVGTYNTTFVVSFPGTTIASQTISVQFTVGGGGSSGGGVVSPSALTFTPAVGGSTQSQFLTITTSANTFYSVSLNPSGSWLTVSQLSGVTSSTQTSLLVTVNPQGLAAGTYTGSLSFNVGGVSQIVSVTMNVGGGTSGGPVSPASLTFSTQPGVTPSTQVLQLTSSTFTSYTVSSSTPWLLFAPNSGTINAGSTAQVTVAANVTGLSTGSYSGSLIVQISGQSAVTVPVTLNVGVTGATGAVNPAQLTFNHQPGTTNPAAQLIAVSGSGSVTATATTNIGGSWLNAVSSGSAPGFVAVSINPSLLTAGNSYTGTVTVNVGGTSVPVTVTANVQNTSQLRVDQPFLSFNYQAGTASTTQSANLRLTTSNGQPISFSGSTSVTSGSNWLSLSTASGTTEATVAVTVNAGGLNAGTYNGSVTFTGGGSTITIPVTLVVNFATLLNSSPSAMNFSYQFGGQTPFPQQMNITSTSGSVFVTQATQVVSGANWLQVTPQSGSTPSFYQVSVSPTGLTEGVYLGTITVQAQSGSAANTLVIPVTLTVTGTSGLAASPTQLTFTQAQGGGAPPPQTITVSSGGLPITFLASATPFSGGQWLAVSPSSAITTSQLTVTVNGSGLAPGTYNGSVVITSQNPPVTSVVGVTLTVTAPLTIAVTPQSLSFTAGQGGSAPPSQTLSVTSIGASAVQFTTSATVSSGGTNWLSVAPAAGAPPSTLTVSVNPAGLALGSYQGTVILSVAGAPLLQIPVTLTISQAVAPTIRAVQSAASLVDSPVSGGMIVAVRGDNLGPTTLATLQLTAQNTVSTLIGETRVLFDGIAAPMVFTRNDIVSCIVPYEISTRASTRVVVEYRGQRSAEFEVRVVEAAPAIFTASATGVGQGSIVNDDGSVNGPSAPARRSTPAQRRFATIYFTGEGQLNPGGVTGGIAGTNPLRATLNATSVRVGGRLAETIFAGAVPTAVMGLGSVSFWIPEDAPTGNVDVTVSVAGRTSQSGVTINIAP